MKLIDTRFIFSEIMRIDVTKNDDVIFHDLFDRFGKALDRPWEIGLCVGGVPFLGEAILKYVFFSAVTVILVVAIAAVLGPKGPSGPPDPTLGGANPRPEWPFLLLFALLSLSPPEAETFIILIFPVLVLIRRRSPRVALWLTGAVAAAVAVVGLLWFFQRVFGFTLIGG